MMFGNGIPHLKQHQNKEGNFSVSDDKIARKSEEISKIHRSSQGKGQT